MHYCPMELVFRLDLQYELQNGKGANCKSLKTYNSEMVCFTLDLDQVILLLQ